MSDEDNEDLPSILFNDYRKKSGDFSMPSADILASQRAREQECMQELQDLRSQFEKLDYKGQLVRQASNSSGSESEASLTTAVEALHVEQFVQQAVHAPTPNALLHSLLGAPILQPYDLSLLNYSALLLETNDKELILNTLNQIVLDIRQCIKRGNQSENLLEDEDTIVLCCWLCASSIWNGPQPCGSNAVLSELLKLAAPNVVETVAGALTTALQEPHALVEASDSVWGHTLGQRCLAGRLLAAAMDALAPCSDSVTSPSLTVTVVCGRLRCVWRELNAEERHAALMVAGRVAVHAEPEIGELKALRDLLALSMQAPALPLRQSPDYLRIQVASSRLQILFEVNNIPSIDS
ncbi:uncharacterized protein LOC123710743 isoform X1 [Pieris brassicae]|uniref:Uncharacterized protein n=1 Tax=Pieris brassicae TaxID=7116 RepID=A0A9P0TN29_PIEBR|nr:uncharacterized protein LOC123710743 isoform X1 [Pieris brassicae]CAH4035256.1 unnamed protein product [Pieris brassicae]